MLHDEDLKRLTYCRRLCWRYCCDVDGVATRFVVMGAVLPPWQSWDIHEIERRVRDLPGLTLAGSYLAGVSVADTLATGVRAAASGS